MHVAHGRKGVVDRQKDLARVRERRMRVVSGQGGRVARDGGLDVRFARGHHARVEVHLAGFMVYVHGYTARTQR